MLNFEGQVAIVTGAGGNPGLGRSYAMLLAARGAKVVVNDLGVGPDGQSKVSANADAVVEEIRAAGGEAVADPESVADALGAARLVQRALDSFGRVDIVINNAGIAPFALIDEISDTDVERVVGVHLLGPIWTARAAWPTMERQGYGRIVNVSSSTALMNAPYQSIYSAAKFGVMGLTRALACEGERIGVAVNCISPEADTLAWRTMLEPKFSEAAIKRGLVPDVVSPAAAWLAHKSCALNGKILHVAAGAMYEIFFSRTKGTEPDPELTPERVADRAGDFLDRALVEHFPDPAWREPRFVRRPYKPSPPRK